MTREELIKFYQYLRKNDCFDTDSNSDSHMFRMVDNFLCSKTTKKMQKHYYVYSYFCDNQLQYWHGDDFVCSESYPSRQSLKENVKQINSVILDRIVILGITKMTEEEFNIYWNGKNDKAKTTNKQG